MKPFKKPLTSFIGKDFLEQLILLITWPQAISMPDEKPMMVDFHLNRIGKHRYIQFYCKVIPHPQIVVACKEEDGDSPFSQCCYFAYKADKTLWDNLVVFKPKIKNIPQQKNGCRII